MTARRVWRLALALGLAACVDAPTTTGRIGEVKVRPTFAAGREPGALGLVVDTAVVVVTRSSDGARVVDTSVAYSSDTVAYGWIVDLEQDDDSLLADLTLRGGGVRLYAGSTTVAVLAGGIGSGDPAAVPVQYVGPPVVSGVTVSPAAATLGALGDTVALQAEAVDQDGHVIPGAAVQWVSGAVAVVAVDGLTGVATAVGNGAAVITATSGTRSDSAVVTVAQTIASVVVTPALDTLTALGATRQYAAEARDANGHAVPSVAFAWSSSNGAAATVDPLTGLATATGDGQTTITASAGGVTGTATLTVSLASAIASITVTPDTATLTSLGATQQFTAVARDGNGVVLPGITFTWVSADTTVARVDATGFATATGNGAATITASVGGVSGTASLTVSLASAIASITVTPDTATVTSLGATQQFTAVARDGNGAVLPGLTFAWTSAQLAAATIDTLTGLATATGDGQTTITASAGGVTGSASLTVSLASAIGSITVTPDTATLTSLGATQQFTAVARDGNGALLPGITFAWTSSNGAAATVDSLTGLATATGNGATSITAAAGGVVGSAALTVRQVVTSVDVTPPSATLTALGFTMQFQADARDGNGHSVPGAPPAWSSSNPAAATIDPATGLATAVGNDTTTIVATVAGVSGTAILAVHQVVATIVVTPGSVQFGAVGSAQQLTAAAFDANGHSMTAAFAWTSSDPSVAGVDASARVIAKANGAATITATADGESGTAAVNVAQVVVSVAVIPWSDTLTALGDTVAFSALAFDSNSTVMAGVPAGWSSAVPAVAPIDNATGMAVAVGNGNTTITASVGGVTGTAFLTVAQVAQRVVVSPDSAALSGSEQTIQFTVTAYDARGVVIAGTAASWSSSAPTVVRVDQTGLATTVAVGQAIITATIGNAAGSGILTVGTAVPPGP